MQEMQETGVWSLGRENLWCQKWQPTPVLLSGKSYEQRNLVGYSPLGRKESWLNMHATRILGYMCFLDIFSFSNEYI